MITAETLQRFIEENDTDAVIQALANMSESERLALQDASLEAMANIWYQAALVMRSIVEDQKGKYVTYSEQRKQAHITYAQTNSMLLIESAQAAVLYCCDFPTLKSAGFKALPSAASCYRILRQRKPKWLAKWCAYVMDLVPGHHWKTIVDLEKDGLITIKHDSEYYQALALGLTSVPEMEEYIESLPSLKQEFFEFLALPTTLRALASPVTLAGEVARKKFRKHNDFSNTVPTGLDPHTNGLMRHSQYLANTPRTPDEHPKRWLTCLCNLTDRGTLDRDALINLSFQSLANAAEEPEKRVIGFELQESVSAFLCSLNDSLCQEKAACISRYVPLLGAANKNVSEFALNVLLNLPDELIPVADICSVLPLTFRVRDKEPATLALKLLMKMLAYLEFNSKPTPSAENKTGKTFIALTLIEAFNNKSKGIHKDAIKLLETHGLVSDESIAAKLKQYLDLLEGTNRIAATDLLKTPRLPASDSQECSQSQHAAKHPPATLQEEPQGPLVAPEGLNETFRALAGIPNLLKASGLTSPPELVEAILAPVDLVSMESPKLFATEELQPITNVDDLVFLASAAMTSTISVEKAELVLDGIARLWKEKPDNFEQKVETIHATMKGPNGAWWDTGDSPLGIVCQIWLQGKNAASIRFRLRPSLLAARCVGLASRICCGLVLPQLAAPTHKGGWIDPVTLTKRVADYQRQGRLLDTSGHNSAWENRSEFLSWLADPASNKFQADAPEFIQALLRMAPDGRAAALGEALKIKGEYGKALRYALGEAPETKGIFGKALSYAFGDGGIESIKTPELALAAFRSRSPRGTCLPLAKWIQSDLPDGVYPAVYSSSSNSLEKAGRASMVNNQPGFLRAKVADGSRSDAAVPSDPFLSSTFRPETYDTAMQNLLCPTIRIHRYISDQFLPDEARAMWLQNREPYLARIARTVLENLDSMGNYWQTDYTILFDQDFPLYETGSWWLALALAAKHDELRRLALDILIAAVEENRVDAGKLGQAMASLHKISIPKWSKGLRELARVSALHALFCWQLLVSYSTDKKQETALGFLELLLELKEEYGFGLSPDAKEVLEQFQGTGKAAKIAKSLACAGEQWTGLNSLQEAAEQSLQSRIARVERWQQSQYFNTTPVLQK